MGITVCDSGVLYLAMFENGISKIGATTNIDHRIKELSVSASPLLEVVWREVSWVLHRENAWHDYFAGKRTHYEYFNLSAEDVEFFKNNELVIFLDQVSLAPYGRTGKINRALAKRRLDTL